MNRLNRKVEYALMALKHMSNQPPGRLIAAKEMSRITGVPFDAASRALQHLCQTGILKAEQGAYGGYMLARNLAEVTLLEVMEVVLGPTEIVRCVRGDSDCEFFANCNVVSPLQNLNLRLVQFYSNILISDLLETQATKVSLEAVT